MEAQTEIEGYRQSIIEFQKKIDELQESIDELESEIERHKREYTNHGGITLEEWTSLHDRLKGEEEKRERLNWQRKEFATDSLPFVMIPELVARVLPQLQAENEHQTYQALKGSLEGESFIKILTDAARTIGSTHLEADAQILFGKITNYLLDKRWEAFKALFGLSRDEEMQLQSVLNRVKSFDPKTFNNYQKRINASLERSKEIRATLQTSSIECFESYVQTLSVLEEELKVALLKKKHAAELLVLKQVELDQKEAKLRILKKAFEEILKARSVSTVSGKALLLLEELRHILYANLIQQVETDLSIKFRELIRKADFFSRIVIDENFTVHILRDDEISKADIISLLRGTNYAVATSALGSVAIKTLQEQYNVSSVIELREALLACPNEKFMLPIEINKDHLSSGEKQIFVMSLYWAMMNQSKNELPFIIDTPFARIDAQHRTNITEHFFKKLTGQLIILSTDEELSNNHLEAMSSQISHVYMLEYGQDKRTHIKMNQYFEV